MRELTNPDEVKKELDKLYRHVKNTTVIIDGKTLDTIFNDEEAMD